MGVDVFKERERRIAEKLPAFEQWVEYLHLGQYGRSAASFRRLKQALWDVKAFRQANGSYRGGGNETEIIAVRVVADTLASEIEAAAGAGQNPDTIRWVTAGLRCSLQPFCTGCSACQTVTSPGRPCAEPKRGWLE